MLYTINEVSRTLGLPKSTIRYYEKQGLLSVERAPSGIRRFTAGDLADLSIVCLLKETSMPLQDIRSYLALCSDDGDTSAQRLEIFRQRRKELSGEISRLRVSLAIVEQKISWCEDEHRRA